MYVSECDFIFHKYESLIFLDIPKYLATDWPYQQAKLLLGILLIVIAIFFEILIFSL